MKKILNISEMKQVRGGAQISSMCGEGEKLYTCTTTYGSGFNSTGAVCAATVYMARRAIIMAKTDQVQADPDIKDIQCS